MNLKDIEKTFLIHTGINDDLSIFPIKESKLQDQRINHKKEFGEVFTPLSLVDEMILISNPQPDKFNIDLCAGHGQFTIRMLRYFTNNFTNFNLETYLRNYHWFNELNPESVKDILSIFPTYINIASGPAEELSKYPEDENGIWMKGYYHFDKQWIKQSTTKESEIDSFWLT